MKQKVSKLYQGCVQRSRYTTTFGRGVKAGGTAVVNNRYYSSSLNQHRGLKMAATNGSVPSTRFRLPSDTAPHAGTIMSWPTRSSIVDVEWPYPGFDVQATREEIARIAQAIAKYEPLQLFVAQPKSDDDHDAHESLRHAQKLVGGNPNVTINVAPNVDCLWARDTGPIFVHQVSGPPVSTDCVNIQNGDTKSSQNDKNVVGLILSFNQWGRKCLPSVDSYFAPTATSHLTYPSRIVPFVGEGGAIEVDGEGTLLLTESSILNPNRNPGIDRATMESYFESAFGVVKTIWLKGQRGKDITDDHIDALARFATPGVVLLSKPYIDEKWGEVDKAKILESYTDAREVLSNTTDAKGRSLKLVDVQEPNPSILGISRDEAVGSGASVSYVNFLAVNGAVVMSGFGDEEADSNAKKIIGQEFPGRVVEQVFVRQLGIQGGGIHCATQNIIA